MIVLDEQLLGRNLERAIAAWYGGSVRFITELRPNTVIKDEAIPLLLRQQRQPTFVTINERDFWQRVVADPSFCVVCFALPDSQASAIPPLLRRLIRHGQFRTKAQRMGSVIRITSTSISYYTWDDSHIRSIPM
jgi:hypothetical protein